MNQPNQQGFTLAIAIVILAVLTLLGFLAWRMYDTNQNTQQPTTDPNEGYVVIKEWGVRFKPVEGLKGVEYFRPKGIDGDFYSITTQELGNAEVECGEKSQSYGLGLLTRAEEVYPENGGVKAKIGKYSYQYRVSSANCAVHSENAQLKSQTLQRIIKSLESLEAAK